MPCRYLIKRGILTVVFPAYRASWYSSVPTLDLFSRLQGWRMKDALGKASGKAVRRGDEVTLRQVCHEWLNSHSSASLITPVALNTVIKEETCVKGFSYWLHTSPAFSFVPFVCMHHKLSVFLHLCSVGLCHLVATGTEKGAWKRQAFMGREGLGEFSAQIWTVSDLQ